jgi:hypothetical protein
MYCQFLGGKKTIICTEYHLSLEKDFKKKYCSTPIMLPLSQLPSEGQSTDHLYYLYAPFHLEIQEPHED